MIFDEAHKLVKNDQMETRRYILASLLASRCNSLLLLTATPHSGDISAFYNRLKLLDSFIIEEMEQEENPDYTHLLIRNIKENTVTLDGKDIFPKRTSKTIRFYYISEYDKELF